MTVAFVFPGQGSQSVGMLDGFSGNATVARVLNDANTILGFSLTDLIAQGPLETLSLTVNTQPAMLACSVAFYEAWLERGGKVPALMAGHSLGEYSALCASGAITLAEALPLVQFRAQAMQEATPVGLGGMAALIGLDDETVTAVCEKARSAGEVAPANFNAPGQVVIAGENAALETAMALAKEAGCRRAIRLPVSAPFHSVFMKPAADKLLPRLGSIAWQTPRVPVVANVDAAIHPEADTIVARLTAQAFSPVLWVKSVQTMVANGVTDIVECGPGKVLTGLVRRIAPEVKLHNIYDETTLNETLDALAN